MKFLNDKRRIKLLLIKCFSHIVFMALTVKVQNLSNPVKCHHPVILFEGHFYSASAPAFEGRL